MQGLPFRILSHLICCCAISALGLAAAPVSGGAVCQKRCAGCHVNGTSGAPKLADMKRPFTAASMVSALWHHGPVMLDEMKIKGFDWPRFDGSEMSNLIAYLNAPNGGRSGK